MTDASVHRPAILVTHDPTGETAARRALALGQPSSRLEFIAATEPLDAVLDGLAHRLTGNTTVDVVHVIDTEDQQTGPALDAAIAGCRTAAEGYPALVLKQWIIAMVGADWTDDELHIADNVSRAAGVDALIIVSRSSEAGGQITDAEEAAMAGDLIHAVLTTPGFRRDITTLQVTAAGATSVVYRRRVLAAAIAAYHSVRILDDTLLAEASAQHPYGELGKQWGVSLGLGSQAHRDRLARGPIGGSVFTDLRPAEAHFDEAPVELLPDALSSYYDQLAYGPLTQSMEQVDRNAREQVDEILEVAERLAVSTLREALNITEAEDYWKFVDRELAELGHETQIRIAAAESDLPDLDVIHRELEREIRRLPYPAAVAVRAAAFGAIGLGAAQILLAPGLGAVIAPIAGVSAAAAVAMPLGVRYWMTVRRIAVLKRKYLSAIEARLVADCELYILRVMLRQIEELRQHVATAETSILHRLDRLRDQLVDLRARYQGRVDHRNDHPFAPTRFSITAPSIESLDTPGLARRFPLPGGFDMVALVARALVRDRLELDADDADETIVDAVESQVGGALWPNLEALLRDAPDTLQKVRSVLAVPAAPIIRRDALAGSMTGIRRLLCVGDRNQEQIVAVLEAGSHGRDTVGSTASLPAVDFDGAIHSNDESFVCLVSLLSVREASKADSGADEAGRPEGDG